VSAQLTLSDTTLQAPALWPACTPRALLPAQLYLGPGGALTLSNVTIVVQSCVGFHQYFASLAACGMISDKLLFSTMDRPIGGIPVDQLARSLDLSSTPAASPGQPNATLVLRRVFYTCSSGSQVQGAAPPFSLQARSARDVLRALDVAGATALSTTLTLSSAAPLQLGAAGGVQGGAWPATGVQLGQRAAGRAAAQQVLVQGGLLGGDGSASASANTSGVVLHLGMRPALVGVGNDTELT
jgi:hypothetical protein